MFSPLKKIGLDKDEGFPVFVISDTWLMLWKLNGLDYDDIGGDFQSYFLPRILDCARDSASIFSLLSPRYFDIKDFVVIFSSGNLRYFR